MSKDYTAMKVKGLDYLVSRFGEEAVEHAVELTGRFAVEVPGWQFWQGFGGGGRFEGGGSGGTARNTREIAGDAGLVQKLTGSTPNVGMHVLWFFSRDGMAGDYDLAVSVRDELEEEGVHLGSISPTYFLAGSENGSFSSPDPAVRRRFVEQTILAAEIAANLGEGLLTFWFPDGTNYPGQRDIREKIGLLCESTAEFWTGLAADVRSKLDRVLFEYKVFEPGTYSTTVPDWGTACALSRIIGGKGGVLVDMGHHHHGTNIEQIVANLIAFSIPGGFHFNTRYAADDDHSVQADYQMARLFYELLSGEVLFNDEPAKDWAFALDQMARDEQRIPSVLKSIDALKRSVAKAALMDAGMLATYQEKRDIIGANAFFEEALLHTDVTPIVMESYERKGLHPVPLAAYSESGYQRKIEKERS